MSDEDAIGRAVTDAFAEAGIQGPIAAATATALALSVFHGILKETGMPARLAGELTAQYLYGCQFPPGYDTDG